MIADLHLGTSDQRGGNHIHVDNPLPVEDGTLAGARSAFAITPSDIADLPQAVRGIYVGTGGDLVLVPVDQDIAVTFVGWPQGVTFAECVVKRVKATGTTAQDLIGLV